MLKGWKTISFAAALALIGLLQQVDVATIISPKYVGLATAIIGGAVALLRIVTSTPVGKSS
jgi:hypothetical protein